MSFVQKALQRVKSPRHIAFYLQRGVLRPALRGRIARTLARQLPAAEPATLSPAQQLCVDELQTNGFSFVPGLNPSQISDVLAYFADKRCYNRWRPEAGTFDIAAAPENCHVAPYSDADVVQCPHLLAFANDPMILGIIQQLFGCKPTISSLSVWWSLTGHERPEEAELFHRDVDEWHFIKLFLYLTDVDEGCGPHKFVKGSPSAPKLLRIRRYEDEEVAAAFGEGMIQTFIGNAGTAFLENTFGLHKGQLPKTNNRLLFQAQYSLFPIGIYDYSPVELEAGGAHFDPYINRLYLRQQ